MKEYILKYIAIQEMFKMSDSKEMIEEESEILFIEKDGIFQEEITKRIEQQKIQMQEELIDQSVEGNEQKILDRKRNELERIKEKDKFQLEENKETNLKKPIFEESRSEIKMKDFEEELRKFERNKKELEEWEQNLIQKEKILEIKIKEFEEKEREFEIKNLEVEIDPLEQAKKRKFEDNLSLSDNEYKKRKKLNDNELKGKQGRSSFNLFILF